MRHTTPSRRWALNGKLAIPILTLLIVFCSRSALAQSPPTGPAGGDLTGTYPNPTLAVDRVRKAGDTIIGNIDITVPNPGDIRVPFTIISTGNALLNRGTAMGFNVPSGGTSLLGGKISSAWGANNQTYMSFSAYNNGAFNEIFRMDGRGLFGIGTANPTSKLHVVSGTDSATTMLSLDTGVHGGTAMTVGGTVNNESTFDLSVYRAGSYASRFGVSSTGNVYMQPSGGNVGIGTTTPAAKLEIFSTYDNDPGDNQLLRLGGLFGFRQDDGTYKNLHLDRYNSGWSTPIMSFDRTNGNVGIGRTAPASRLEVAGTIHSTTGGVKFPDGSVQTTAATAGDGTITGVTAGSGLTGGGTTGSVTLNVVAGTGITVATDTVSVNYGSTAGTAVEGNKSVIVSAGDGLSGGGPLTLGNGGTVTLTNADRGSSQNIFKNIANSVGANQFSAGSNSDAIRFAGSGGTSVSFDAATKKVTIDGSTSTIPAANVTAGQFGTGNYTFPGNVIVNGSINAKYQDLAEWVPSSEQLSAGTVVVLDTTKSNQVISSTVGYDMRVAGVISAQPGITLGEGGDGKVLVATTGRVRVKVDASRGPIQIGDLLVTSDVAGVAMKSEPVEFAGRKMHMPGTIIGKALEPLAKGSGEILVLLSLQ